MPETKKSRTKRYRAVVGIDDADGNRYEPGDTVPASLVNASGWLLSNGKVEEV